MGKRNQANGHKFEIRVWNIVKRNPQNLCSCISSGSKGFIDVWSLEKKKLRACICKLNGYLDPKERKEINEILKLQPPFVQLEFWYYKTKRKIGKMIIDNNWEFKYSLLYATLKKRRVDSYEVLSAIGD